MENLVLPPTSFANPEDEVPASEPMKRESTQGTAKRAIKALVEAGDGFVEVGPPERRALAIAFATAGKIVYGRAFDIARLSQTGVDLKDPESIAAHMSDITLYEVKSTNRKAIEDGFEGYFFSLSTAELLVAQSLGDRFKFMFVNVETGARKEMSLHDIYRQARAIYPVWSISLGKDPGTK